MGKLLEGKRGAIFGVANERSIAWACAKAFADQGALLALNYLGDAQEKRVRKLIQDIPNPLCAPCDASSDGDIEAFFELLKKEWGALDFIVHSMAYAERSDLSGRFVDTPRANFALALDISSYSLIAIARQALPLMTHGGSIVAMTYYGSEKVMPKYNVMGVAKAALETAARYLAEDLGPGGIRVNCISAGPIRTLSSAAFPGFKKMLNLTASVAPLRRNVTQDEVAKSALYLVSDLSSGVTGEVLHVDSGYNILGMFASEDTAIQ